VHPPTGMGVPELLRLATHAFPSPELAPRPAVTAPGGGAPLDVTADPAGPLVAEVVRTSTDPYVGRLSVVRVFSGTLTADDRLHVSGHLEQPDHPSHDEEDERIGQLLTPVPGGTEP